MHIIRPPLPCQAHNPSTSYPLYINRRMNERCHYRAPKLLIKSKIYSIVSLLCFASFITNIVHCNRMGTPTKKRTPGQRKQRALHFAISPKTLARCPKCKKEILPHHACSFCGYYRGRQVLTINLAKKKTKTATA